MRSLVFIALPLATMAVASSALGATQTFTDDELFDADWDVVELVDQTFDDGATFSGLRVTVGGNPGAFRGVSNTWSHDGVGSVSVVAGHMRQQADYDPSIDGAITTVSFAFDASTTSTTYPLEAAIVFAPVLEQAGAYYVAGSGIEAGFNWASLSEGSFFADDFALYVGDGPAHPDFTATGGPITFGFAASSGPHATAGLYTTTGGLDSWQVTVSDEIDTPDAGADAGGDAGTGGGSSGGSVPPSVAGPPASTLPRKDDGCSVRPGPSHAAAGLLLLIAAALGLSRRRR